MSVKNWSTTAGSNATVDSINFAEGQNPSSVNDSARALMADVKEWYNEITGGTRSGTVSGTDTITLTTTPSLAAYATNQRFLVKAAGANTVSNPTLNVSSLGAKTIKLPGGAALPVPAWATNDMLLLAYDGTDMILVGGTTYVGTTGSLPRNAQTGTTYTVVTGDRGQHVTYSNASAIAVTLPQANSSTFGAGWFSYHENVGDGLVTITPTTSTINGAATLRLSKNQWALITSDNTNYRALVGGAAGIQTIYIPAGSWTARTDTSGGGPAAATLTTTTNKITLPYLGFDASTIEYAQASVRMPNGWNEGAVNFSVAWSHGSTTTNFGVVWGMQAVAISNDDAAEVALGTAQTSTDTGGTTDDVYFSDQASTAVTIAGTPAAEDLVVFQIYRNATDGSDTMAVDARLHGVTIYYTVDSTDDR